MCADEFKPMTAESVGDLLRAAGAEVMVRSGRTENYSAPREFSFEVRATFPNGLGMQVVARQFNYRDPWEATGRVNDMVDVSLLRDGVQQPAQFTAFARWGGSPSDTTKPIAWLSIDAQVDSFFL